MEQKLRHPIFAFLCVSTLCSAQAQSLSDSLIAHFPLDGSPNDLIGSLAPTATDGQPGFCADRFGNPNSAACFDGASFWSYGDVLDVDTMDFTLAAWVRLDRLGAPFQSLLHTDGWNESNPGQVHWMVTRDTTMRLALIGNTLAPGSDEVSGFPDSRTPVLPEQGRWVHLVAVYDSAKQTARFYLNGRFDNETRQATAHPARLGPAQIGNWNSEDRKLSGRIDEMLVLGRAMSDAEVMALFSAGNPYQ